MQKCRALFLACSRACCGRSRQWRAVALSGGWLVRGETCCVRRVLRKTTSRSPRSYAASQPSFCGLFLLLLEAFGLHGLFAQAAFSTFFRALSPGRGLTPHHRPRAQLLAPDLAHRDPINPHSRSFTVGCPTSREIGALALFGRLSARKVRPPGTCTDLAAAGGDLLWRRAAPRFRTGRRTNAEVSPRQNQTSLDGRHSVERGQPSVSTASVPFGG